MKNQSAGYMIKATKLLTILISWILVGVAITVYDHFTLHSNFSSGSGVTYTFTRSLLLNITVGLGAAVTGGTFLVFFVNDRLRDKSYLKTILMVAGSFVVVSSLLIVFVSFLQSYRQYADLGTTWDVMKTFLFDAMHIKNILIWSVVVAFTQFALQVNDKFGKGVLINLLLGRYHQPKEETRIFMFVDLMSSTSIAEKLNIDGYHRFLRDFFADITNAIVYNRGEIYQYVGDEIVISWKLKGSILDNRCLQCYFDMRLRISQLASRYVLKYGIVPDFKAGLHYGKVIAGEIGIIKRDITFSGDVLNTTSRIQGKCKEYSVKILSSDELLNLLPASNHFRRIPIGEIELRGKENKVSLSTLEMTSNLMSPTV